MPTNPGVSEVIDKNGVIADIEAKRFDGTRSVQLQGDITASQTWNGDSATALVLNTSIGAKKVTTDKINDKAVGTAQIADDAVGLTQIDDNAMTSAATSGDSRLITSGGVRTEIDNAILNRGKDYGPMTPTQINAISETIPTGSTVHVTAAGTITDGDIEVRQGEDLKYYRGNGEHYWYSMDGNFKLKQQAKTSPTASGSTLEFIDSITQDENGEITASKKAVQDGTTSQKGAVQLAGSIGAIVASENNKAATEKAVRDAINNVKTIGISNGHTGGTIFLTVNCSSQDFYNTEIEISVSESSNGKGFTVVSAPRYIGNTFSGLLKVVNGVSGNIPIRCLNWTDENGKRYFGFAATINGSFRFSFSALGPESRVAQISVSDAALSDVTEISRLTVRNCVSAENNTAVGSPSIPTYVDANGNVQACTDDFVHDSEIVSKANIVSSATAGNFAGLDSNGDLTDSGSKASDFATAAQGSKADSAIQGVKINNTTLMPDSNKVVTVPLATTSADGAMSAADKTKLDGIAEGAEANVQADWDERNSSSDAFIKNKPQYEKYSDSSTIYYKVCKFNVSTSLGVELVFRKNSGVVVYTLMNGRGLLVAGAQKSGDVSEDTFGAVIYYVRDSTTITIYAKSNTYCRLFAAPLANLPKSQVDFTDFGIEIESLPEGYEAVPIVWVANAASGSGTAPVKVDAYGALTPVPMDNTPTASSTNLMTSGAIKTALDAKQSAITWMTESEARSIWTNAKAAVAAS